MMAHTSMLRRLPHAMPRTALAACTCVLAIAATVNIGVDWAIDDSEWARYLCCGLVTTVAAIWFAYKPQQGSYVIIAVAVGDFLIGGTAFAPMLILALLATGSIGYTGLVEGVLSGIALLAAVFFSPYTVAFPVIDNSLLSFPCLVALTLSISALIRRNGERQRQLQRGANTACQRRNRATFARLYNKRFERHRYDGRSPARNMRQRAAGSMVQRQKPCP